MCERPRTTAALSGAGDGIFWSGVECTLDMRDWEETSGAPRSVLMGVDDDGDADVDWDAGAGLDLDAGAIAGAGSVAAAAARKSGEPVRETGAELTGVNCVSRGHGASGT